MSSNPGLVPNSTKIVTPSQSVSSTAFYSTPSVDSGSQRRTGGSGSFGAGLAARNSSSPRNNQAFKSHHKRQRRPRLLDDDEYSETVCASKPIILSLRSLVRKLRFDILVLRPS